MKRIKEFFSVLMAKKPSQLVLVAIILLNIVFFTLAALIISMVSPLRNDMGFWESLYRTITMVLDAGCIDNVVYDPTEAQVATILICLLVVLVGMVMFTGAVIGYLTNFISTFIESASAGERHLSISEHTVVLNWNNRASEILNELLFSDEPEKIVVLAADRREEIKQEIAERLADTVRKENDELIASEEEKLGHPLSRRQRRSLIRRAGLKNRLTWIVRKGDTFSSKQLLDISLDKAKAVIILGKDDQNSVCRFELAERAEQKGNALTVKTLVQVAEICDSVTSRDGQKIIVEIDDEWTAELVDLVIAQKRKHDSKCQIVPVPVNHVLGQMLAQFSIMPELNQVYRTLFSNKGGAFFGVAKEAPENEDAYIQGFLARHRKAVPLSFMDDREGVSHLFYVADHAKDLKSVTEKAPLTYEVKLNKDYWMPRQNVIILGHNSKSHFIMNGFEAFRAEWNRPELGEIMDVLVIDDTKNLERVGRYSEYPYVRCVDADIINDKKTIYEAISAFVDAHEEDTSVLILSNDRVPNDELDSNALTYLIYVQDIVEQKVKAIPGFDREKIDIVVEILNPKNYDVVHHYSVRNVVISNRYVSKMVTQIGKDCALFDFYNDILTYDADADGDYESKEIYAKIVDEFFAEVPHPTTADQFVRALYEASAPTNRSIALGYVQKDTGKMTLFTGDLAKVKVELGPKDKLLLFSNH